jgi:DNA primase
MPFFSEETLQAVRSIPLYDIVRTRVELSRSGRNWKGLSPFSQEKTPSFYVLTEKNFFKCFSSGLAGDGIRFVQETEKLTFPEAVEALAERFGIAIQYASGEGPDPETRSLRQELYDIHDYARDHYHQALLADHPLSESVRSYWIEDRGFSLELAKEFQVGFSPPKGNRLMDILLDKGFSTKALAESGLFHTGRTPKNPRTWFPVFRGRLMIPIRDHQRRVVAFTARQLDVTPRDHGSWKAKYINSPETLIFKKGQLLFNLDRASEAVAEAGRILLVEGQLDALRSWDCGLREAVAPQGTAVTEEQMNLVKRYTDHLDVLLDSDEAGLRAVLRLLPIAFQSRLQVRVIRLPEGEDPDDFLRHKGAAGLDELDPESGIAFAGKALLGPGTPSPEDRARVLSSLFKILSACPSAVVREGYFEEAVAAAGVSRTAALEDYRKFQSEEARNAPPSAGNPTKNGTKPSQTLTNPEADLLWAVSQNVAWAHPLAQVIDHQWISSTTVEGKLLSRILAQTEVDHIEATDDIQFLLETDEERDCFSRLVVDDRPEFDMVTFVNQTLSSLARRFCRARIEEIEQEISKHGHNTQDWTDVIRLKKEQQDLKRQLVNGPFPEIAAPA